jgi:uncharacterized protein YcfJ
MIKKLSVVSAVIASAIVATGCATYGGYQPVVDTYNNPNAYRLPQDQEECRRIAREAGSTGRETLKGAGVGALGGAAAGAALGAILGDPGKGAALGAVAGGIGGAGYQGMDADNQFRRAYINCLRNRGHRVAD